MTTETSKKPNAFTIKPDLSKWVSAENQRHINSKQGQKRASSAKTRGPGEFVFIDLDKKTKTD